MTENVEPIKLLSCGLDTLVLNYWGPLRPGILEGLEELRELAIADEMRREVEIPDFYHEVESGELSESELESIQHACLQNTEISVKKTRFEFKVMPHSGGKMFRYLLMSPDMDIKISAGESEKSVTLQVYLHSRFLWSFGPGREWERAWLQAKTVAGEFVRIEKEEISRLDLAADFEMEPEQEFRVGDIENFLSRAVFKGPYNPKEKKRPQVQTINQGRWWMYGKNFTGFSFGTGKTVMARVYDKTKEILGTEKAELFEQVWGADAREDLGKVWRIEFQFRRPALKDLEVTTIHDLRQKDGGLWEAMTERWLSLRAPNPDNSQRTKWPVDGRWQTIAGAALAFRGRKKVVVKRTYGATERGLLAQIAGCSTALGAIWKKQQGVEEKEEFLEKLMRYLWFDFDQGGYEKRVAEKEYRYQ